MNRYDVYRISDGAHIYAYTAESPVEYEGMEFATHEHRETLLPPPPAPEPLPPPTPVRITRLAFRSRFTQAEKVALELASLDNAVAPMAQRQQAAALRVYLADVEAATFIDLTRADTRAGVQTLESGGLIAAGRAAQILDTPPAAHEAFTE